MICLIQLPHCLQKKGQRPLEPESLRPLRTPRGAHVQGAQRRAAPQRGQALGLVLFEVDLGRFFGDDWGLAGLFGDDLVLKMVLLMLF